MSKGRAVSNAVLYDSITIPENPGSKTCIMQQTAGTQRDQKILLPPSIPETSGEYPPWKGLGKVQLTSLQTKQRHQVVSWWQIRGIKEPVSSGSSSSLASIYLELPAPPPLAPPKRACGSHSFNYSPNTCWASTRKRHWNRCWIRKTRSLL